MNGTWDDQLSHDFNVATPTDHESASMCSDDVWLRGRVMADGTRPATWRLWALRFDVKAHWPMQEVELPELGETPFESPRAARDAMVAEVQRRVMLGEWVAR